MIDFSLSGRLEPEDIQVDILPRLKTRESPKGILRLCVSSEFRYAFA